MTIIKLFQMNIMNGILMIGIAYYIVKIVQYLSYVVINGNDIIYLNLI